MRNLACILVEVMLMCLGTPAATNGGVGVRVSQHYVEGQARVKGASANALSERIHQGGGYVQQTHQGSLHGRPVTTGDQLDWLSTPISVMVSGKTFHFGKIKADGELFLAATDEDGHLLRDRSILEKVFFIQYVYRLDLSRGQTVLRPHIDQAIEDLQIALNMSYLSDVVLFVRDISARTLIEAILAATSGGASTGKTIAKALAIEICKDFMADPVTYLKGVNYVSMQTALDRLRQSRTMMVEDIRASRFEYERAKEIQNHLVYGLSRSQTCPVLQGQLYLISEGAGDLVSQVLHIGETMVEQLIGKVIDKFEHKRVIERAILGAEILDMLVSNSPAYSKCVTDIYIAERLLQYDNSLYHRDVVSPSIRHWASSEPVVPQPTENESSDYANRRLFFDYRLVSTLKGHEKGQAVRSVDYAHDGTLIASGSDDGTIKIWNADTMEGVRTLDGHKGGVNSVEFSPDGRQIASTGDDSTMKFWETETGRCLYIMTDFESRRVSFSPNGKYMILQCIEEHNDMVFIWGAGRSVFVDVVSPTCFDISPDGRFIAAAVEDIWTKEDGIAIGNLPTGEVTKRFPPEASVNKILCLAFSSRADDIAIGTDSGSVLTLNLASRRRQELRRSDSLGIQQGIDNSYLPVNTIAYTPNGQLIISGRGNGSDLKSPKIEIWDVLTNCRVQCLASQHREVECISISPGGKRFVSGSGGGLIEVWEASQCVTRKDMAERGLQILEIALDRFNIDTGRYPVASEGLLALLVPPAELKRGWKGPYIEQSQLLDPWGNHYFYYSPARIGPYVYELKSFGADGEEGGEGYDADLSSTDRPVWSVTPDSEKSEEVETTRQEGNTATDHLKPLPEAARVAATKRNLKLLHAAVLQFRMDTGRWPDEEEGLYALIHQPGDVTGYQTGGYLDTKTIPKDSWGNDFMYIRFPESGAPFAIMSYGADGAEGGEGYDADLLSTDKDSAGTRARRFHVVRKGETLQDISRTYYGDPDLWRNIYESNREVIPDTSELTPGMKLIIPNDIPVEKLMWVKCNNPACNADHLMSKREYYKGIMAKQRENPTAMMSTPALVCEKCGRLSIYAAIKCPTPACGIVFIEGRFGPNDYPDRCPKCKRSKTEERIKARRLSGRQ